MANVDGSAWASTRGAIPDMSIPRCALARKITTATWRSCISGATCGWDQAAIIADGPFLMADPTMTFILIRAHRDLAALARALGEDPTEIEAWAAELETGLPRIWNPRSGSL